MREEVGDRRPDPVDLVLEGDLTGAIERYSELYIRSLKEGDRYIGYDLCTQLLYTVAAKEELPAEQAVPKVRTLLKEKPQWADLPFEPELDRQLDDDLRAAKEAIGEARTRAEKSIQAVEAQSSRTVENY